MMTMDLTGCTMQGASVRNPSAEGRRTRRIGKEDLRSKLKELISEIPVSKADERAKVNHDLRRITSLEASRIDTTTAHKKKPTLEEIIAEMEAEIERMGW